MKISTVFVGMGAVAALVVACGSKDQTPPANQAGAGQAGYGQPQGYPQQPGAYPQQPGRVPAAAAGRVPAAAAGRVPAAAGRSPRGRRDGGPGPHGPPVPERLVVHDAQVQHAVRQVRVPLPERCRLHPGLDLLRRRRRARRVHPEAAGHLSEATGGRLNVSLGANHEQAYEFESSDSNS